jgi:hypothetical protein
MAALSMLHKIDKLTSKASLLSKVHLSGWQWFGIKWLRHTIDPGEAAQLMIATLQA